ncbi:sarcosine oxidase subunit gamma [Mangrovicoccus algicola]|uniref:Sarcosine oxidase subunit gamma n=1 Tax=Mangrovicoccus algicola TaxID=2771008 RepID=A0A8J6YW42_9RHOB|nr:sarcosine oxidase subunit gamma family protein [Mangrovicoccus algicola]MBE3638837.1 sarcosine oxidase subunit gamma [Mangrovicoccus algicola]
MTAHADIPPPGTLIRTAAARIGITAAPGRLSLRARDGLGALGTALGIDLPGRIGGRAGRDAIEAMCLGPDEWVLLSPPEEVAALLAAGAAVYAAHPHSLVDISGRETTIAIDGPRAAELLTLGLARDPAGIAPGDGRRTYFDGQTVILWRDGETRFRMDVWHSFAPHLLGLLDTGCRELAAEAP